MDQGTQACFKVPDPLVEVAAPFDQVEGQLGDQPVHSIEFGSDPLELLVSS